MHLGRSKTGKKVGRRRRRVRYGYTFSYPAMSTYRTKHSISAIDMEDSLANIMLGVVRSWLCERIMTRGAPFFSLLSFSFFPIPHIIHNGGRFGKQIPPLFYFLKTCAGFKKFGTRVEKNAESDRSAKTCSSTIWRRDRATWSKCWSIASSDSWRCLHCLWLFIAPSHIINSVLLLLLLLLVSFFFFFFFVDYVWND